MVFWGVLAVKGGEKKFDVVVVFVVVRMVQKELKPVLRLKVGGDHGRCNYLKTSSCQRVNKYVGPDL